MTTKASRGVIGDASVSFAALTADAIASQAEAEAGTADDKLMTPERTAQAIAELAAGTGGWVPIKTVAANSDSSIDFVNGSGGVVLDGTYRCYAVVITELVPASDGSSLYLRTSTNAGSSYDAGSSDYAYGGMYFTNAAVAQNDSAGAAQIDLGIGNVGAGNQSGESLSAILYVINPANATVYKNFRWSIWGTSSTSAEPRGAEACGHRLATSDIDAIRFLMSTGNITSGTFTLYGLAGAS